MRTLKLPEDERVEVECGRLNLWWFERMGEECIRIASRELLLQLPSYALLHPQSHQISKQSVHFLPEILKPSARNLDGITRLYMTSSDAPFAGTYSSLYNLMELQKIEVYRLYLNHLTRFSPYSFKANGAFSSV